MEYIEKLKKQKAEKVRYLWFCVYSASDGAISRVVCRCCVLILVFHLCIC